MESLTVHVDVDMRELDDLIARLESTLAKIQHHDPSLLPLALGAASASTVPISRRRLFTFWLPRKGSL